MAARAVLLGSDPIALPTFTALAALSGIEVVGVWSQPDRPSGRGQTLQPNEVSAWALAQGFNLFRPEIFDAQEDQRLAALQVDLAIVMAYGQLLREPSLVLPRLGFVNFHGSLLPALRGATPVEGALALGLTTTGIALQQVVRKLDAGPLLAARSLKVAPDIGRVALRAAIGELAAVLAVAAIPELLAGRLASHPQDEAQATYTRRLRREDAALDFTQPAQLLAQRIRALQGWPGSTCLLGEVRLKVGSAQVEAQTSEMPAGTVLSVDATRVQVATGAGVLNLLELQRPGGKMLPMAAFITGFEILVGAQLVSEPMLPLVGSRPLK